MSVSYTHRDVYKRQVYVGRASPCGNPWGFDCGVRRFYAASRRKGAKLMINVRESDIPENDLPGRKLRWVITPCLLYTSPFIPTITQYISSRFLHRRGFGLKLTGFPVLYTAADGCEIITAAGMRQMPHTVFVNNRNVPARTYQNK